MYCQIRSDEKLLFDALPERVVLADGFTRTGLADLSAEELRGIGVYPVVGEPPEFDPYTQQIQGPTLELVGDVVEAAWMVEALSPEEAAERFEAAKEAKRAEIAAARFAAETGGCSLGEHCICTDREAQALLTGAALTALARILDGVLPVEVQTAMDGLPAAVNWKGPDGWMSDLSDFDLVAAGIAVRTHVQACFDREKLLSAEIEAAETGEEVEAITWTKGEEE